MKRLSIQNFLAMKFTARMSYFYHQRSCCVVHFIARKFQIETVVCKIARSGRTRTYASCRLWEAMREQKMLSTGTYRFVFVYDVHW